MRGRSWASGLFLGALVLLVGAGAGGWYAWQQWRNAGTPRPPEVAPEDLDSDVAALVKAARERVLREPRSAAAWGALAEVFHFNDRPEEARTCYLEAARLDPNDPRWPYLLGTLLQRSHHDEALAPLRRAAALAERDDPENPAPLLTLAEQLLADDDLDAADALVQKAARIDAGDVRVQYNLGVLALRRDQPRAAVEHLLRAAASPFARQKANVQLGLAHERLGEADRSAACAAEARKPPADDPWPDRYLHEASARRSWKLQQYDTADYLIQRRNLEEAVRVLRAAIPPEEHNPRPFMMLGQAEFLLRHFDKAATAFSAVLAASPDHAGATYHLAAVRYYEGEALPSNAADGAAARAKYEEALRYADAVLKLKPDDLLTQMLRGSCLSRLGRREEALETLHQAVRHHQEVSEAHLMYGEALADAGRTEEAVAELKQAVELAPVDELKQKAQKALDKALSAQRP
jgi:tetratricopeptide (TPR) repeat protein